MWKNTSADGYFFFGEIFGQHFYTLGLFCWEGYLRIPKVYSKLHKCFWDLSW